ncbi:acetylcholine receptor non-alpha chain-like [Penaeus chinensis]|uniref:acetylcholine receptor non-alpha chain-like n=1 Tax=Penaeus chinensis TaxID=139456 RepID=UPI001FB67039|nr:acetylcholine receptor non-alpha chain-like [Penaeus chinensis]
MLAMMVFLMAMTENLPPTETLPLAGVYYGVCLIVLTCNIAFSVYVLNLSYSGDRGYHIPQWVRTIALMATKVVFMKVPEFIIRQWGLDRDSVTTFDMNSEFKEMHVNVVKVNPRSKMEGAAILKDDFQRRSVEALESIQQHMEEQTQHYDETQRRTNLMEEWKFLSRVLDRVLFILFGITTFLFNIIILTQSPFGEKFEYCPLGPGLCSDGYSFGTIADIGSVAGASTGGGGGH